MNIHTVTKQQDENQRKINNHKWKEERNKQTKPVWQEANNNYYYQHIFIQTEQTRCKTF